MAAAPVYWLVRTKVSSETKRGVTMVTPFCSGPWGCCQRTWPVFASAPRTPSG
jgi:hypothetical protein